MKEFICVVCGEKGIDSSSGRNRKFCSKQCADTYWNRMRRGGYKGYQACKYNGGISCIVEDCENCGWNPAVAEKRKEALV